VFLGGEVLPAQFCRGTLAEEESPVLVRLCLPVTDPPARTHDLWSSVGQPARSSLELAIVAPLRPALVTDIAAAAEEISLNMNTDPKQAGAKQEQAKAARSKSAKGASAHFGPGTVAPTEKNGRRSASASGKRAAEEVTNLIVRRLHRVGDGV
jgi:hypothetical protein